jgi:ApaG protein
LYLHDTFISPSPLYLHPSILICSFIRQIPENGTAWNSHYVFAYQIRIEYLPNTNNDDEKLNPTVQLMGRTWRIQGDDGRSEPICVDAPTTGAVGHCPVLNPGDVFTYMSGCEIPTPKGSMNGMFHMAVVPSSSTSTLVGENRNSKPLSQFLLIVPSFPLQMT